MKDLTFKPIFDCSLKEIEERLRPEIEKVERENLSSGLYNVYSVTGMTGNSIEMGKSSADISVRHYAARKELVSMNPDTGITKVVLTVHQDNPHDCLWPKHVKVNGYYSSLKTRKSY